MVRNENRVTNAATVIVTAVATTLSRVQMSSTIPAKKSIMASSGRMGMKDAMMEKYDACHASKRNWRTITFSRGEAKGEFHCMYSRSHCFVIITRSAVVRPKTRLMKNRALIHRAESGGANEGEASNAFIVMLSEGVMGL